MHNITGRGFVFTAASFATVVLLAVSAAYLLNARETIDSGRNAAAHIMLLPNSYYDFAGIAALHPSNAFSDAIAETAKLGSCTNAGGVQSALQDRLSQQKAAGEFQQITGVSATVTNIRVALLASANTKDGCTSRMQLTFGLTVDAGFGSKSGTISSVKSISYSGGKVSISDDFFHRVDYSD